MTIKELFGQSGNGQLSFEDFQALSKANGCKFADLSDGEYVSKNKYETDLANKTTEIETLTQTIATRDTDLANLGKQLEEAGTDKTKLDELTGQLNALQTTYADATKAYEEKLANQAYEFAVKELAGTKNFTSQAAKRDFVQSMIAEKLKFKNNEIVGADDFISSYTEKNADAFVVEEMSEPEPPLPQFVGSTPGGELPTDSNAFAEAFHFTGVRPIPN